MTEMAIDRAIKEWETKTCIKFVPRTNETDYVEFFRGKGHVQDELSKKLDKMCQPNN